MGIYWVVFVLFLFGSLCLKPTKGVVLVLAIVLFVISAGRGESVGIDTVNYYQNGFSSVYSGDNHQYEIVFVGLCDLIRLYGLNPRCCLYLLSAVTIFFVCAASRRFKTNTILVLFFFLLFNYFTHSLNVARQMAACSILLYAYSFLFNNNNGSDNGEVHLGFKNLIPFVLFVLFAASFHVGAILGLLALFSFLMPFNKKKVEPILVATILVSCFAIVQIGRGFLLSRTIGYLSAIAIYDEIGSATTETTLSGFGFVYRSLAYVFYSVALVYLKRDSNNKLFNFFLLSLVLKIILSAFYGSIFRLNLYFALIDIIVFSLCVVNNSKKRKTFFYLTVLYFGIDYYLLIWGNTYETVPYVYNMIEIF